MSLAETPLDRARAKCEQLERELRKSPDFQLYLFAKSRKNRAAHGATARGNSSIQAVARVELFH